MEIKGKASGIGASVLLADNALGKAIPTMQETSLSLLERLRHSPENEGWSRLADLYAPLVRVWLRRYDVQDSDANDLVQEVLLAVSKELGTFEHRGQPGAFRGWLKAILINRLRKFWRATGPSPRGSR